MGFAMRLPYGIFDAHHDFVARNAIMAGELLLRLALTLLLLAWKASLPVLALVQVACMLFEFAVALAVLRRRHPEIRFGLASFDRSLVRGILGFSLFAMLLNVGNLLGGISPDIFVVVGPFTTITSCMVHANLDWTFGPLRYVFVSPVFHRWHHARAVCDKNFASTFSLWDLMFGTYHMPVGELPKDYGIDDKEMPEGLVPQMLYPILQRGQAAHRPAPASP